MVETSSGKKKRQKSKLKSGYKVCGRGHKTVKIKNSDQKFEGAMKRK